MAFFLVIFLLYHKNNKIKIIDPLEEFVYLNNMDDMIAPGIIESFSNFFVYALFLKLS